MARKTGYSEWGAVAFRALACLVAIGGGAVCHAIIMASNFDQGWHSGSGDWGSQVYGYGALAIDLIGVALLSVAAGVLYRANLKWQARRINAVVALCAAFSLAMFYGFGAANRIEPAKQMAAKRSAEMTAKARSDQEMKALREQQLERYQKQAEAANAAAVRRNISKETRDYAQAQAREANEAAAAVAFGTIEIKADPIAITPDPMAAAFAADLGWEVESVQKVWTLVFGSLLLLVGTLAIRLGAQFWPRFALAETVAKVEVTPEPKFEPAGNDNIEAEPDGGTVIKIAEAPAARKATPLLEAAERELEMAPSQSSLFDFDADMAEENEEAVRNLPYHAQSQRQLENLAAMEQVERFINDATRSCAGKRVGSKELYDHYLNWRDAKQERLEITHNRFGRTMTALHDSHRIDMPRRSADDRTMWYVGRMLDYSFDVQEELDEAA